MSSLLLLADIRQTDVWDLGNAIGVVLLLAIVAAIVLLIRVVRRR